MPRAGDGAARDPDLSSIHVSVDDRAHLLRGVRVLDAGSFIAAPLAAALLGDWGADVVKLEPLAGDASRGVGDCAAPGMSATFLACNRGKRSIALDYRSASGRAVVRDLAAACDVVIHNLPPAVARRIGLDHPSLLERRADAVLCTVTAFGDDGPYAGRTALDPIIQAMSGLAAATGEPDGAPMRCGAPVIDTATAFAAAAVVLAALHARDGGGVEASVSLLDVALAAQGPLLATRSLLGEPPPRRGNASYATLGDQLATADGLLAFVVWDDRRWRALCALLDLEAVAEDPRFATNAARCEHQDDLRALLQPRFAARPGRTLERLLLHAGIACAVTQDLDAVVADPHVRASGALVREQRVGGASLDLPAGPARVGHRRPRAPARPPRLGEHTDELLAELANARPTEVPAP